MDAVQPEPPEGYDLVRPIGQGGGGVVWEAVRRAGHHTVALKLLNTDVSDAAALRRFEREKDAMTALAVHPGILTIHEAGITGGRPWLAMELCRRGSLARYVGEAGAPSVGTALWVLERVATALQTAHDSGIVHCDVKPANLMVTDRGEPAVGDFGIARVTVGRATTTTVGGFSLDHVAPELLDDEKSSPRSDVYSLGTTVWELLAGHPPFRRTKDVSVGVVIKRIMSEPLGELPEVPTPVLELLREMTEKEPAQRVGSMTVVAQRARALAAELGLDLAQSGVPALDVAPGDPRDDELQRAFEALLDPELQDAPTWHREQVYQFAEPTPGRSGRPLVGLATTAAVTTVVLGATAVGLNTQDSNGVGLAARMFGGGAPPTPVAEAARTTTTRPPEPTTTSATTLPPTTEAELAAPLPELPELPERSSGGSQRRADPAPAAAGDDGGDEDRANADGTGDPEDGPEGDPPEAPAGSNPAGQGPGSQGPGGQDPNTQDQAGQQSGGPNQNGAPVAVPAVPAAERAQGRVIPAENVRTVPSILGMTLDQAKATLAAAGFPRCRISSQPGVRPEYVGRVVRQSPAIGQRVEYTLPVEIVMGAAGQAAGPADDSADVDDSDSDSDSDSDN